MRLVSLCHQSLPSHHTNTQQLVWTATELARLGHQVAVVHRSSEADGATALARIADYYGLGALPDSIDFIPVGPGKDDEMMSEARADVRNVIYARRNPAEIVHTRDPLALTLALVAGLPCIFETYRIDLNEAPIFRPWQALNYPRKNLLGIVTHSDLCRRSFIQAGVPETRLLTNYNGYAPAHFTSPLTREEARLHLGLPRTDCIATYTGHIEATKGIDFVVRVAQQLPEVIFLLVGAAPGSEAERRALRLIQDAGAGNVRLQPRVPPSEVAAFLFASDCLIIPPTAAPLRQHGRTVLPMKTFSYLAAGRPIVAPDLPDLREILRHDENALLVAPDDVAAAAEAIRRAVSDRTFAAQLGRAARRDAADYTWAARAARFSTFLRDICGSAEGRIESEML
ncbi:MAG: glycosyltransferase family 4 protein, partial [Chthoniobacterales bacterium]